MSLVARVAISKLIMGIVKVNKHSGQRITWRIDGKHAALSWKNRRDCIPHSPLSPHLRKTTGRAGPWQLMAANVGDMYFHCNMKICCCLLLYCFYRWLLFSQFATYNALQLTSIHQFNPRPTGGGAISSPPLVFLEYLLNRCRYHRQTCSNLSPNIFTHCVKILKSRVS